MQADPAAQALLLQIVDLDTQMRQATIRKRSLPEHEQLAALNKQRKLRAEQQVAARTRIEDAETVLERTDADLDSAKARMARNEKRLDDGLVTDPRSIQATQDEIAHLKERINALEDQQLDAMQTVEDEKVVLEKLVASRNSIEDEMRTLLASRDATTAEIDQALEMHATQRAEVISRVPADLLKLYTKIAERQETGAALLKARRCTGCGLALDATALTRITNATPAEVFRCEECGRILVRTAESGL